MDVLHIFGSTQSDFYYALSRMYAEAVLRPKGISHRFAAVAPDGRWRFGPAPDTLGAPMPLAAALERIGQPDLVVPHMFCRKGMTAYRALIEDVLGHSLVGSHARVAGLATSKLWTRDVCEAAGVTVARAERLAPGMTPRMQPPYVVKPDTEDNSLGISAVTDVADAPRAVAEAFQHDDTVFAEAFVPGREIRAAVVETDDGPIVPAFIEYPVSEARPIRAVEDKLQPDGRDGALRQSTRPEAQPTCPASVSPSLAQALRDAALAGHAALGARHYALFDFRIHRDTGEPVMLEAGLFWSFSELSAISKMLAGAGLDPVAVTAEVWRRAAA